ncbi:MAG: CapA family protein [Lutispora sp.]|nr:CapA family protein [Lutispora sp.]
MSRRNRKKSAFMRRIRFIIIVAVVIIFGKYMYTTFSDNIKGSSSIPPYNNTEPDIVKDEKPKEVTIKISAIGDVALGRDYRFAHKDSMDDVFEKNNEDYGYFFSSVAHIFAEDDLTIANLENAFTLEEQKAEKYDYGNNYWFKGDPKYARVLKEANIEVVNLANNHTYDFGQKGYDDTKETLENLGIGYFGYDDIYETNIKGINIGVAGFNELGEFEQGTNKDEFKADIENKIKLLKSNNDFVIANFHWGKEYVHTHNETQTELAYFAIDSGADFVIGTHPHVIQGIEKYKDKYILYSLGNFGFGGNKRPPDFDTFIYQQEIVFNGDKSIAQIKEPDYIPCYISSVKHINDYQPTPAKGSDIVRILNKINKYSTYKMSEDTIAEKAKPQLVNLQEYIPNILIELKYATTDNVTGEVLYESNEALLRVETAKKLKVANEILNKQGYRIKIWDAYRPSSVQQKLWDKAEKKIYFADPKIGSNHTRGCTVDVTLTDLDGVDIDMPSGFDDMTGKATRKYVYATPTQKQNAQLLEKAMKQAGFNSINIEWWHFDDSDYKLYDFIDNPIN